MLVRCSLACCLSLSLLYSPQADSGVFGNLPDVLVCSVSDPTEVLPWDQLVFYVSARVEGGGTLYKSLTANPILITIEGDGQVVAPNLADCDGKSLSELRRAGQAADFASR